METDTLEVQVLFLEIQHQALSLSLSQCTTGNTVTPVQAVLTDTAGFQRGAAQVFLIPLTHMVEQKR